jgi:hypothetical protein
MEAAGWYTSNNFHGVTSQKTKIYIVNVVRISIYNILIAISILYFFTFLFQSYHNFVLLMPDFLNSDLLLQKSLVLRNLNIWYTV